MRLRTTMQLRLHYKATYTKEPSWRPDAVDVYIIRDVSLGTCDEAQPRFQGTLLLVPSRERGWECLRGRYPRRKWIFSKCNLERSATWSEAAAWDFYILTLRLTAFPPSGVFWFFSKTIKHQYGGEYWTKMLLDRKFACILSYRTRYALMSYSVVLYCNRNTVLSYSVTVYRNQNSIVSYSDADVSYPVVIYRNLYAVVSYSVTWYRNLNDIADAAMSYPKCGQRLSNRRDNFFFFFYFLFIFLYFFLFLFLFLFLLIIFLKYLVWVISAPPMYCDILHNIIL